MTPHCHPGQASREPGSPSPMIGCDTGLALPSGMTLLPQLYPHVLNLFQKVRAEGEQVVHQIHRVFGKRVEID